jgi:hypothetical protein
MEDNTIDLLMAEDPKTFTGPDDPRIVRMVAYLRQNRTKREENKARGKRAPRPTKTETQQVLSLADLGFKPKALNIKRRV